MSGVMEGADHAGDVVEYRALEAALVQRPPRFTIEVDDHKLVSRVQDLAELKIAVAADTRRGKGALEQAVKSWSASAGGRAPPPR